MVGFTPADVSLQSLLSLFLLPFSFLNYCNWINFSIKPVCSRWWALLAALVQKKPCKATEATIRWPLGVFLAVHNCCGVGIWICFSFYDHHKTGINFVWFLCPVAVQIISSATEIESYWEKTQIFGQFCQSTRCFGLIINFIFETLI